MSVPGMARRYRGLVLGGAAAAAFLGSDSSVALADDKKKADASAAPYFDPEALERGAKALREINASPHAKQASQSWSTLVTRHLRVFHRLAGATKAAAFTISLTWLRTEAFFQ
jgi:ATPase family AAA domain-containing protein 3A/B